MVNHWQTQMLVTPFCKIESLNYKMLSEVFEFINLLIDVLILNGIS